MPALYPNRALDRAAASSRPQRVPMAPTRALSPAEEALLDRAVHLAPSDRVLLDLSLRAGRSVREIAELLGRNHGSIVRRLRELRNRLLDPLIAAVADPSCCLEPRDREILLGHRLRREPVCALARRLELSPREINERLQFVHGWFTGRKQGVRLGMRLHSPD